MASPAESSSLSKDTPAESSPRGDVGGQPSTFKQPSSSDRPPVIPGHNANVPQSDVHAPTPQRPDDNEHPIDDTTNTFANQNNISAPGQWVDYPSSPPQRAMSDSSTTSSPSPSEKIARGEETSAWLMDQASSSGPWSLPVTVLDSQSNHYPLTLDEGLSSGGGSAAETPPPMAGERQG